MNWCQFLFEFAVEENKRKLWVNGEYAVILNARSMETLCDGCWWSYLFVGLNTFDSIFVVFCLSGGTLTIFSVLKINDDQNTSIKTFKHTYYSTIGTLTNFWWSMASNKLAGRVSCRNWFDISFPFFFLLLCEMLHSTIHCHWNQYLQFRWRLCWYSRHVCDELYHRIDENLFNVFSLAKYLSLRLRSSCKIPKMLNTIYWLNYRIVRLGDCLFI